MLRDGWPECVIAVKESDSEDENDEEEEATEHAQYHYIIQYVSLSTVVVKQLHLSLFNLHHLRLSFALCLVWYTTILSMVISHLYYASYLSNNMPVAEHAECLALVVSLNSFHHLSF